MRARGQNGARASVAAACAALLASCTLAPPPAPAPAPTTVPPVAAPATGQPFQVVAGESLLQILVYRDGAMARLGHNHIIASRSLSGRIQLANDPRQSAFDISFPVSELTVDELPLRAAAGEEFSGAIPDGARDGTRRNLLSAAVLDAERYPGIRLRSVALRSAGADRFDIDVEVTLKDQVRVVATQAAVRRDADRLIAEGQLSLKQSDLGLQPFSVLLGTLSVRDELQVRYRIVGVANEYP